MAKVKPSELWKRCSDLVFERSDRFGPLHEAMRAAVILTVEGDKLVVGLSGENQYLRGHLETPANRHQVCACLKELTGRDLDYQIIEGTAREDWDHYKEARERLAQRAGGAREPVSAQAIEIETTEPAAQPAGPWQEVMERLHYAYQQVQARTHPMVRAQFLLDALPIPAAAEAKAAREGESEERIHRSLSRALERIAMLVDVSPTQVALELLRYRAAEPQRKTARKPGRPGKK
jgi:hypothetical protein